MMKMNEKLYIQKSKIKTFFEQQKIRIKFSSFYIQTFNNNAEYLRDVIKQKIITMKKSSNLFKQL